MAERHFGAKYQHTDEVLNSVDEDNKSALVEAAATVDGDGESLSDGQSQDESDDEASSSDDDENIIAIQRPQFLSKSKRQKLEDSIEVREAKRRDTLNEKITQENKASEAREKLEAELKTSFGTDDDLVRRIMLLDDNDSVDPEFERQEWLNRCAMRRKLRRDALLAKQLELEQYEANKLTIRRPIVSEDQSKSKSFGHKVKSAKFVSGPSRESRKKYRPSKAHNPQFSQSTTMPVDKEESEYSYI